MKRAMSRRKQSHPRHLDEELPLLQQHNNDDVDKETSDQLPSETIAEKEDPDAHVCGKCGVEFLSLEDFIEHKYECKKDCVVFTDDNKCDSDHENRCASPMDSPMNSAMENEESAANVEQMDEYSERSVLFQNREMFVQSDDETEDEARDVSCSPLPPQPMEQPFDKQSFGFDLSKKMDDQDPRRSPEYDESNVDNGCDESSSESSDDDDDDGKQESGDGQPNASTDLPPMNSKQQMLPNTNVILESLQNTKVAVAQFPCGYSNPNDLIALQSALLTLQQQQVMQLQLIQQLQSQLLANGGSAALPFPPPGFGFPGMNFVTPPVVNTTTAPTINGNTPITPPSSAETNSSAPAKTLSPLASSTPLQPSSNSNSNINNNNNNNNNDSSTTPLSNAALQYPDNSPSPGPNQPNSLELLQRHTQQTLESAQSSMLSNGLSPLSYRKGKPPNVSSEDQKSGSRDEPFFRHRCRYCGKVFGSDSALQIHIRSHTGERPYKCNICGNRFTTKGNLKVHFQRHKQKYPHIRMNPNPVPEHLDKLHPALYPGAGNSPPPPTLPPILSPITNNFLQNPLLPPSQFHHRPDHQSLQLSRPPLPQQQPLSLVNPNGQKKSNEDLAKEDSLDDRPPPSLQRLQPLPPPDFNDDDRQSIDDKPPFLDEMIDPNGSMKEDNDEINDETNDEEDIGRFDEFSMHVMNDRMNTRSNSPRLMISHSDDEDPIPRPSSLPSSFSSFFHDRRAMFNRSAEMSRDPRMDDSTCKDPSLGEAEALLYNHLLPTPGSTDNAWESLMEVTKPSETTKLQQLVDNIEHKLSDPNQCIICHRVLSCKSALQMHYRTHTGERPFKCKLCGRAFTTKGNLKTHMGVHRVKPPMNVLHQCPVCHKKFTNALVLQQHIRIHTGEPTDLTPEQIKAAEITAQPNIGESVPIMPTLPANLPMPRNAGDVVSPSVSKLTDMQMNNNNDDKLSLVKGDGHSSDEQQIKIEDDQKSCSGQSSGNCSDDDKWDGPFENHITSSANISARPPMSSFATSLAMLESQVKGINASVTQSLPFGLLGYGIDPANLLGMANGNVRNQHYVDNGSEKSNQSDAGRTSSPEASKQMSESSSLDDRGSPTSTKSDSLLAHTQGTDTQRLHNAQSPDDDKSKDSGALDLTPKTSSGVHPSLIPSMSSPVFLPPFQSQLNSMPLPPTFPGHFSTTCNICLKTFACSSALDIHYRSHTKERPFKCHACDRGFSTKGNMKQHMLTHKIRDLPSNMFSQNDSVHSPGESIPEEKVVVPDMMDNNNVISHSPNPLKRPLDESGPIPIPKRPLGFPKHMCHVCNKNFSSASALQIHMRTHTGDKPFKCNVCERAFTTKGNLKVHMGTHMWNNGTSRRGRRMSIEVPPLGLSQKEAEFHTPRRPDMFFPYLPSPYLNGMSPKLGEMAGLTNAMSLPNSFGVPHPMSIVSSIASSTIPTSSTGVIPTVTSSMIQNAVEADLRKSSSGHAGIISPISSLRDQQLDLSKNSSWMWKMQCSVCRVTCSNPMELDNHMKSHFKNEKEDANKANRGENVVV